MFGKRNIHQHPPVHGCGIPNRRAVTGGNSPQGRNTHTHPNITSRHLQTVDVCLWDPARPSEPSAWTPSGVSSKAPNRLQHVHLDRPQPSQSGSSSPTSSSRSPANALAIARISSKHTPHPGLSGPPSTHPRAFGDTVFRGHDPGLSTLDVLKGGLKLSHQPGTSRPCSCVTCKVTLGIWRGDI